MPAARTRPSYDKSRLANPITLATINSQLSSLQAGPIGVASITADASFLSAGAFTDALYSGGTTTQVSYSVNADAGSNPSVERRTFKNMVSEGTITQRATVQSDHPKPLPACRANVGTSEHWVIDAPRHYCGHHGCDYRVENSLHSSPRYCRPATVGRGTDNT